jgi:hypothetical protein
MKVAMKASDASNTPRSITARFGARRNIDFRPCIWFNFGGRRMVQSII